MRQSRLLLRTLREAPSDAEAASHRLLLRGGYIRRVAAGVYAFLPLGLRVLRRIESIVRAEFDAAGAQEILLPVLQPVEAWAETGRLETMDDVLFRVEASGGRFVLGPTHEELATRAVSAEVDSYRDLPVCVYQLQLKYRDEARPRFGPVRGREFLMADAYSFDKSAEDMRATYDTMYDAVARVFERVGLEAIPVAADPGAIGGDVSHEWMVVSPIGEDTFVRCAGCGYAANTQVAEAAPRWVDRAQPLEALVEHHTPARPGIDLVVDYFRHEGRELAAAGMLKCLALRDADGGAVVVLVPGDREVRIPTGLAAFDDEDFARHPQLVRGYIGPMGLQDGGARVLADHSVRQAAAWATGANKADHHVTGALLGRDFTVDEWGSFAVVAHGDPCPTCGLPLALARSVEAGHTFQNGLYYSAKMAGASFIDAAGTEQPLWTGCYGIGVSRLVGVIAEAHHDESGLAWPKEVAPFAVHLLAVGADRSAEVAATASTIYEALVGADMDVLYDDRDVSPGVKFADADLLGIPTQYVVGAKGIARGVLERKDRATGVRDDLPLSTWLANWRQ